MQRAGVTHYVPDCIVAHRPPPRPRSFATNAAIAVLDHLLTDRGYRNMVAAAILSPFLDVVVMPADSEELESALWWFCSEQFERMVELIGLDPETVRQAVVDRRTEAQVLVASGNVIGFLAWYRNYFAGYQRVLGLFASDDDNGVESEG